MLATVNANAPSGVLWLIDEGAVAVARVIMAQEVTDTKGELAATMGAFAKRGWERGRMGA